MSIDAADKSIAILGAGMSGVCAAVLLQKAGFTNIQIYEKSDRMGGVWRDNTYPGCGCDVPSHLYSYSFAPNPDWPNKWSRQPEILKYIEDCANRYHLRRLIRFSTEISALEWDETAHLWRLTTTDGDVHEHHIVITALGQLNRPNPIDYEGLDAFGGAYFHSARWDHDVDLEGKTVAVIGNGPSAVQLIPEIAPRVKKLVNLQRSPSWVRERSDITYKQNLIDAFRRSPWRMKAYRDSMFWLMDFGFGAFKTGGNLNKALKKRCLTHLHAQVTDPDLRQRLTPDFPPGCKRILISDDFYPALARANVEVVRAGLDKLNKTGVVDTTGAAHDCDVVIFATGFQSLEFLAPMEVKGVAGATLKDAWSDGAEAHRGVALSGFPNFFMLYGPNTNLGHTSILYMVEAQAHYIRQCLEKLRDDRITAMQPKPAAQMAFNENLQIRAARTVWAADCANWYKNEDGRIVNNWPSYAWTFKRQMAHPRFSEYDLLRVTA